MKQETSITIHIDAKPALEVLKYFAEAMTTVKKALQDFNDALENLKITAEE